MKNELPKISSYGEYSSDNYGVNSLVVDLGPLTLYFSYKTIIAFTSKGETTVSENCWGTTTGKHLNWIDNGDKKARLERGLFEAKLAEVLASYNLQ